ncbi:MAG: TonB-dependent receptor [Tannerellaceae bacterium]|nr:TonB-dependent receptor [Tannerellaceae bacterium]
MKQKQFNQQHAFRFKKFAGKGYAAFNSMHKTVNIGVVAGCVLSAMTLGGVRAQEAAKADSLQKVMDRQLDEVTVTAARPVTPLSQTAKLVTVITREEIERSPIQTVQDILLHSAHIDVVQRGGRGVQADISLRGGTPEQNLILLNGINLSNPHTGHYNLDIPLNPSDIERIEIIHGPSALIYGAGSFSGAINIITKKPASQRLYARAEGGMYRLTSVEARSAAQAGPASYSLSAGFDGSGGYIAGSDYNIYNVLLQTHLDMPATSTVDIQLGYNDKRYGANTFYSPRYPDQYEHTSALTGSVKAETGHALKFIPSIYWSRHYDMFELNRGSDNGRNHHRNDAYGANILLMRARPGQATRLALDIRRESIVSSVLGKPMDKPFGNYNRADARTIGGMSVEHTVTWKDWMASAGVLVSHTTLERGRYKLYPSLNVVYRPSGEIKLTASWSRSTRLPTFTDLYYTTETHLGDGSLRPESSGSLDLGVRYVTPLSDIHLTGFMLRGSNMIDWVKTDARDDRWASWNLTEVNTTGLETGLVLHPHILIPALGEETVLTIGYTRMRQLSDAKKLISAYALNYLRDKMTVSLVHPLPHGLSAAWYFRLQKRMGTYEKFEGGEKTSDAPYPAFSTVDLKLSYRFRSLTVYLNLNNLYNTHYFDRGNIPQPGFCLTIGAAATATGRLY